MTQRFIFLDLCYIYLTKTRQGVSMQQVLCLHQISSVVEKTIRKGMQMHRPILDRGGTMHLCVSQIEAGLHIDVYPIQIG